MTISGFVEYVKQAWKNKPDTSTPVSAERLNHIEEGIKANSDALAALAAVVCDQVLNDPEKIASLAALYSVDKKIGNTANLPNSAVDVVTALTTLNSNFADATKVETHIAEGLNVYKYGRIVSFVIVNATTNSNGVLDKVIPSKFSKNGWQIPCLYYIDGQKLSGKLVPDTSGNLTLYDASITKVPLATLVTASSTWII